jgi:hypothetical protein
LVVFCLGAGRFTDNSCLLFPMALPSIIVTGFDLTGERHRDQWSDFLVLSSPIFLFWSVFWIAASFKESIVEISNRITSQKSKFSNTANVGIALLGASVFLFAGTVIFQFGISQIPDWGECTRPKCFAGEYLLGSRSTIAGGLFLTSIFLSLFGLLPLRFVFIANRKQF